jgi:peptidoglycan/xylan/chitin deacetylase (PgdA/CDA1 family)
MNKAKLAGIAGAALKSPVLQPLTQRFYRNRLPIVFYHGIWPAGSVKKQLFWGQDIDVFRTEMRELSRRFRFVTLDDVIALNASGAAPSDPVMAVTFDDGHEMVRTGALEVLEEFGIPSTLFVITSCVGNGHLMWMHALNAVWQMKGEAALVAAMRQVCARRGLPAPGDTMAGFPFTLMSWSMDDKDAIVADIFRTAGMLPVAEYLELHRPYFDWDELASWIGRGQCVGLHTATHPFCSQLSEEGIRREIVEPAQLLRQRLGIDKLGFAYPFGDRIASLQLEQRTCEAAGLTTMLGVTGTSVIGTPPWRIERVDAEQGLDAFLYARPIWKAALGRA